MSGARYLSKPNGFSLPLSFALIVLGSAAYAQQPSTQLVKALSYKPRQADVNFEQVARDDMGSCTIEEKTRSGAKGFWITGKGGTPLRWFADTNGDNALDQWSYFKTGVEVYRESDTDFNGTADEYRWLSTEGLRRGVDKDEDGDIETWTMISAEEATAEVVAATKARDLNRFSRLLISEDEIAALGLGKDKESHLKQLVADAKSQFRAWAAGQNVVTTSSEWTNFAADKPGVVPAGTDGSEKDVVVYENAVALVEDDAKPRQLLIGTLIQVGNSWRIVSLPRAVSENAVVSGGGFLLPVGFERGGDASTEGLPESAISKVMQRLVEQLTDIDQKLSSGDGDVAVLQAQRADVIEKLVAESDRPADRTTWIRQFADTVSAAAQTGDYPGGVRRMNDFIKKLGSVDVPENEIAYVVFRAVTADHNVQMQAPKAKYEELQERYLKNLESFVRKYPESPDAAEAMIQIGLAAEFSGEIKEAKSWYSKASAGFRDSVAGRKAAGAFRRLNLEGRSFQIQGKRIDGGEFDSRAYAGGPVVYHGWASWCEACKAEMRALKELQAKYAKSKLKIVGINFDSEPGSGINYLRQNSFPWVHLYEDGGLESDLAIENGFLSLPVNIVVDSKGKVVATGVHWTELDEVLADLVE